MGWEDSSALDLVFQVQTPLHGGVYLGPLGVRDLLAKALVTEGPHHILDRPVEGTRPSGLLHEPIQLRAGGFPLTE